jgi:DHA1 family bicyclomycin/chloramphenicol resistance-like MFS transporter
MVKLGTLLALASGLLMFGLSLAGIDTVFTVVGPVVGVYIAAGMILPNSSALAIAPHARIAGSASALLGFLQMSVASLAGWVVGYLHNGTTLAMAGVMAACTLLAALVRWKLASSS